MKKYFVAKTATSSGFIGRMSINDIATKLGEQKIRGDYIATEVNDWSYDQLLEKQDVQWEPVSQLLLQKSQINADDSKSNKKVISGCIFAGGASFVVLNVTTGVVPGGFLGGIIGGVLGTLVGLVINAVRRML